MSFRLVPELVTLNDLERRNGSYIALFHRNLCASLLYFVVRIRYVVVKKVCVRYLISWWAFCE